MTETTQIKLSKVDFKAALQVRLDDGENLKRYILENRSATERIRRDVSLWHDYTMNLLQSSFTSFPNSYSKIYQGAMQGTMDDAIFAGSALPYDFYYKFLTDKTWKLGEILDRVDIMVEFDKSPALEERVSTKNTPNNKIFVVHGHNEAIRLNVARTLEHLKLKPIILHEQVKGGGTIIELFESYSDVGFAIVLLTDDDLGKSKDQDELNKRARQNVILELGYFIAKLSRKRVFTLVSEGVERPSDLDGLLYTKIDKGDAWKYEMAKELQGVGYEINMNDIR